jgi:hypothetical protein
MRRDPIGHYPFLVELAWPGNWDPPNLTFDGVLIGQSRFVCAIFGAVRTRQPTHLGEPWRPKRKVGEFGFDTLCQSYKRRVTNDDAGTVS